MCLIIEDFLIELCICIRRQNTTKDKPIELTTKDNTAQSNSRVLENAGISWIILPFSGQETYNVYNLLNYDCKNSLTYYHQKENLALPGWQRRRP